MPDLAFLKRVEILSMSKKNSNPEIIDGHLAPNVVPFEKPKKKIAQDQFDVEWFYEEAEFFGSWMDEFDW
tara:strand:- start:454 stop:663 length:210 start_codon:yes stop_codon:yes gene_type:complete